MEMMKTQTRKQKKTHSNDRKNQFYISWRHIFFTQCFSKLWWPTDHDRKWNCAKSIIIVIIVQWLLHELILGRKKILDINLACNTFVMKPLSFQSAEDAGFNQSDFITRLWPRKYFVDRRCCYALFYVEIAYHSFYLSVRRSRTLRNLWKKKWKRLTSVWKSNDEFRHYYVQASKSLNCIICGYPMKSDYKTDP